MPAASGTGNGAASYIVEPTNLTSARVGILIVAGQAMYVIQYP